MKAYVYDGQFFMWAIENSVGKGAMNGLPADVSYIQWYYVLAANFPETPPERKAIYSKVKVTGQCTGTASDPLVQAIIAHQQGLKHPVVDGKVSGSPAILVGSGWTAMQLFLLFGWARDLR